MDGGYDHPFDGGLYACAYASRGRRGIPSRYKAKSRDDDDDDVLEKGTRRWGY
jgi:hypothetical protein